MATAVAPRPLRPPPPGARPKHQPSSQERKPRVIDADDKEIRLLIERATENVSETKVGKFLLRNDALNAYARLVGEVYVSLESRRK